MTIVLIAIIAGVIGLDQLTKWLAVVNLQGEPSFPLWREVLHFTYVENRGMAFGMMQNHRWVFMVFSTVAIIALVVYLFRFRPESRWMQISMAFIIGGGIGNMIDRLILGYVIDFIDFTLINFAVFNVADSFVCIGAGMMIGYLVIDLIREIKREKAQKAEAAKASEEKNENDTTVE
jgi:signal peptidase II